MSFFRLKNIIKQKSVKQKKFRHNSHSAGILSIYYIISANNNSSKKQDNRVDFSPISAHYQAAPNTATTKNSIHGTKHLSDATRSPHMLPLFFPHTAI